MNPEIIEGLKLGAVIGAITGAIVGCLFNPIVPITLFGSLLSLVKRLVRNVKRAITHG
ncbi:YtxH domain-containing protein [Yersinia aleksiciae]|uniref:YtxH domain-containing protein n=1 Tax=Yersinia aleksiciae TaxID=263819 RepID=UPI0005DDEDCD|nr:YtxH domain-containing protein [Yersinia aleksiciae]CNE89660.1 Uncharacterised protein [Yersinia enterocolitica]CNF01612.1 Uncharacterised protein [Yersinia mollaretii]MDA5499943.1 YtxH domain-containing protein [Yersinia aleksiciae]NIL01312.1 YtxH domain-containing protein [Yersinia aleksiciae]WQC69258.1 YtxH domain-containing protein [Yersinia aleksiciae]